MKSTVQEAQVQPPTNTVANEKKSADTFGFTCDFSGPPIVPRPIRSESEPRITESMIGVRTADYKAVATKARKPNEALAAARQAQKDEIKATIREARAVQLTPAAPSATDVAAIPAQGEAPNHNIVDQQVFRDTSPVTIDD